jgi:predicted alpha/beta-hydrolase family hydrolase
VQAAPTEAERFAVAVGDARTSAVHYRGAGSSSALLILAHGAGAPQTHPWMVRMARTLAERAIEVVTFNFLYTEAKRKVPDKAPALEATWRAVAEAVRRREGFAGKRLYIGGKSMGGRMATHVAADATDDDALGPIPGLSGLVLLGYPLHPPGQPSKLRVEHLARVRPPMLFVQGSRDTFGGAAELEPFVRGLASRGTRVLAIEGGDHSLVVPKKSGVDAAGVFARVADAVAEFTASR